MHDLFGAADPLWLSEVYKDPVHRLRVEPQHLQLVSQETCVTFVDRVGIVPVVDRANILVEITNTATALLHIEKDSLIHIYRGLLVAQDQETIVVRHWEDKVALHAHVHLVILNVDQIEGGLQGFNRASLNGIDKLVRQVYRVPTNDINVFF